MVSWQRALVLWFQDKVEILEYHSDCVRSASKSFQLPSVIRLKQYIRPYFTLSVKLSRHNLFLRDEFTCQYCLTRLPEKRLTIDHVHPISKGGKHEWSNVVAACSPCNNKKGDKSLAQASLRLRKKPSRPRWLPSKEFHLSNRRLPDNWHGYLRLQK